MAVGYPDIDRLLQRTRTSGRSREDDEATIERELVEKLRRAKVAFAADLKALFRFMLDPAAPAHGKTVAVAALLYFVTPLDAVPDAIPVLGFADDAAVIAAAVTYLGAQLRRYRT